LLPSRADRVGLIAFVMFRYIGDPVNQMVGVETSAAERAQLREQLGLDEPVIVQALRFSSTRRAWISACPTSSSSGSSMIGARCRRRWSLRPSLDPVAAGRHSARRLHGIETRQRARQTVQALSLVGISLPTS